jgi:uncharacterized membrane protein
MKTAMSYLHHASFGIGVLGVLIIVFGVAAGMVKFVREEFSFVRGRDVEDDRKRLRHVLGYYLLLGLEFLIAADIIDTLMKPSVQDLIVLGAIVLIRTVISFSLNAELRCESTGCSRRREEADTKRARVFPPPYVGGYARAERRTGAS